jgi:hypothetical protein
MIAKANQGKGGLFSTPDKGKKWLSKMHFGVNDAARVLIAEGQSGEAYKQYRKLLRQRYLTNKALHASGRQRGF